MRKVKYISVGDSNVTHGKVYDVIEYIKYYNSENDIIQIINDHDDLGVYFSWCFKDATSEYRNIVIDEILS